MSRWNPWPHGPLGWAVQLALLLFVIMLVITLITGTVPAQQTAQQNNSTNVSDVAPYYEEGTATPDTDSVGATSNVGSGGGAVLGVVGGVGLATAGCVPAWMRVVVLFGLGAVLAAVVIRIWR